MKLVDKIQEAHSDKLSDYSIIYTPTAEVIEKIADDYAIEFAQWVLDRFTFKDYIHRELSELLEKFKKEKGL